MSKFSNRDRPGGSQTLWGLHIGKKNVQQPWQIGAVLKPRWLQVIHIGSSATMADQAVLKHSGGNSYYTIGSATMADQVVLKQHPRWQEPLDRFSDHGRSGGSQTPVLESLPNISSVTMADQVVLKPVGVDMPFDLGISISKNCKICQVFLFLRPARSFFRSGSRISASVYSRPDGGMGAF